MIDSNELGHRHLLAVDGLKDEPLAKDVFVRIIVPQKWAESRSGQLLVSCLVNLLCRQAKLVRQIEVVSSLAAPLIQMPNGDQCLTFPSFLSDIAVWAVDDTIPVTTIETDALADITVWIGEPPPTARPGHQIVAVGDAWRAWIGNPEKAIAAIEPTSRCPIGPFLAAALAAGEIYKATRGINRGRLLSSHGFSLWSGQTSEVWSELAAGPETNQLSLEPTHIFGAGAVGNAAAYLVANLELSSSYFIVVDDDTYDGTNLNRCLLAGHNDREHPKVEAVGRTLGAANIDCFMHKGTIKSYIADARVGLRPDVAEEVNNLHFRVALSCVDKGIARQDVQGIAPILLCGGSTLDLQAKANIYGLSPDSACLSCFNRAEPDGDKIRTFEKQLRNMAAEARRSFLGEKGLDPTAIQAYMDRPECGGLGEAAVRDFATRHEPEFSAGFVSLGAGLLLIATLLRKSSLLDVAPSPSEMTTLNFLNGGLMGSRLAVDEDCRRHAPVAAAQQEWAQDLRRQAVHHYPASDSV